ncbi:AAA family ATPase [Intrasporangium flavum]|uniref:AAA family ATPase n=1 Tax=Intrasporangium flavum TaxID=1428657 RepID=UPI00096CE751|nr:ATP-binding protein [Intrasporangium flavum]
METTLSKDERLRRLNQVFTPSAPVARRDLFAGRLEQVFDITSAIAEPGKHIVIYGERGVGKTSLANVLHELVAPIMGISVQPAKINCSTVDKFTSLWTKVCRQLKLEIPESWTYGSPDPDEIRVMLAGIKPPAVIIMDEFDRIEDDDTLSLMADTLKALSDHAVPTKLVIVGVADSIDQLVGEHESVQRAIAEVAMPRMTEADMTSIIDNGLPVLEMGIESQARTQIGRLAEGLPHYVHLLTQKATLRAIQDDRTTITTGDVEDAISVAVAKHSLAKEYQTAIQSPRPDNLFARVLTSCALAEKNRLGGFTSRAVRDPLSRIMGRVYEIPAFAPHLKAFTDADRGSVLKREGTPRRYTYRFRNPLLQPFAVLTALSEGLIPEEMRKELLEE